MTRAFQMPVRTELATRTGPRLWRKTVLKAGHISKNGIEMDVDRGLLETLAANFAAGAKDQVQLVLADAKNRHNELPERVRGEILDLAVTDDDRLEAVFGVTARGDALLTDNPRLGASVSFVDRFERADGRDYGPTLLHVAGTLDPEIAGLGDWVRADLSADAPAEVIDLSGPTDPAEPPAQQGGPTPVPDQGTEDGSMPAPTLSAEEIARLRDILDRVTTPDDQREDDDAPELSDEELALLAEAALGDDEVEDDEAADTADEHEPIAASADEANALQLANARIDAQQLELSAIRRERDEERYHRERDQLAREFGIPPRLTDLCARWLTGAQRVQLSSGESADPGADIRKLLREFGTVAKLLDLTGPVGTAHELSAAETERSERDAFLDQARARGFAR